jgi:hypothetical protein
MARIDTDGKRRPGDHGTTDHKTTRNGIANRQSPIDKARGMAKVTSPAGAMENR